MAKWLDNYNESKVTLPEGFVGMGNNTKGRNYSPAWGGQFAMGGSIPGSVGFTYARTQDPAPSNGLYAKKTKASAENGKKFSLEDVKKNATSKKYPSAKEMSGGPFQEIDKSLIKGADVVTDLMQLGNFVPHPVGQSIGKAGNVLGGWIDAYQAADAYDKGNYGDAAINLASVALPIALGSNTFKRNSKYLKKGQPLNFLKGKDRVKYIEPFTKVKGMTDKSLMANRALLGTLGAETAYDSYQNGGEMKYYQEGLDFKPKSISKKGGWLKKYK